MTMIDSWRYASPDGRDAVLTRSQDYHGLSARAMAYYVDEVELTLVTVEHGDAQGDAREGNVSK
jgi:hypothetical protein